MKKLFLVRHAKSSWEFDVIDHERPLKERGHKDANIVSKYLSSSVPKIDLIISSDAVRAKKTAEIFISNLNFDDNKVMYNHQLYDFSGSDLIRVIASCDDTVESLMLFGHNHALTAFVNTYGDRFIDNVPTSGLVCIEFEINHWKDLKQGKTIDTLFPRDLKS